MFFIAIFAEKLRFLVALEPFLHDLYYKGVSLYDTYSAFLCKFLRKCDEFVPKFTCLIIFIYQNLLYL